LCPILDKEFSNFNSLSGFWNVDKRVPALSDTLFRDVESVTKQILF
jgi:hypothetical protein